MPQLDGVRGVAVLLVITAHLMPSRWGAALKAAQPSAFAGMDIMGPTGVEIFFVLSGFLITAILLKARRAIDNRSVTATTALRVFYFRRTVRIFPIYYLCIGFTVVAGIGMTVHDAPWHALYLTNIRIADTGILPGSATHLWSLAVEEQFYLFWPALVLLAPKRLLEPALITLILLGTAFRIAALPMGWKFAYMLLPGCVDLFALGGLLSQRFLNSVADGLRGGRLALASSLILAALATIGNALSGSQMVWPLARRTIVALGATWLISHAAGAHPTPLNLFLGWRPARFIGKISYGIYLFHNFVPEAVGRLAHVCGINLPGPPAMFAIAFFAAIATAAVSWRFIENPILRLKNTSSWGRMNDETHNRIA